ncbi:MAG: hypothetical protein HOW97_21250, partial [Catenulispora sp.]|nr:hypothetical protein [Catenulispora sp.]
MSRIGTSPLRSWGLALRVARREALRHKGRSLLVVAMLALPVAGASAADTLWRSSQVTGAEQAVRDMGRYDAMVSAQSGAAVYQNTNGSRSYPADPNGYISGGQATVPDAADLAKVLPAGSTVVGPMARTVQAVVADDTGRTFADLREVDLADPLTEGIARHRSGTAPVSDDQVAISRALADDLHKGVGDSISVRIADPGPVGAGTASAASKTLRVTGIYDGNDDLYTEEMFVRRGTFTSSWTAGETYLVAVPGGMDWSLVQKLNQRGFTAESKKVVADPPPHSQMPYYTSPQAADYSDSPRNVETIAVVATALAMVLLEVVLLAGPAFAVSARRRRRDFGLLGAAGADGRRLRRVVLADGVVLGLAGGAAGAVVCPN